MASYEVELAAVKMVQEHVNNTNNRNSLIPSLIISDPSVQNLINTYNSQLLSYQKLVQGAGPQSPLVKNSEKELESTREAIIASINNLLSSITVKLNGAKRQEQLSQKRISDMPTQSKAVTSVSRQQKIKEELYLYLLSKREENAMNLAVTVANAKVVESATQTKVAPSIMMFALVGLMLFQHQAAWKARCGESAQHTRFGRDTFQAREPSERRGLGYGEWYRHRYRGIPNNALQYTILPQRRRQEGAANGVDDTWRG